MPDLSTWIATALAVLTAVVIPLVAWAFRLQMANQELKGRVKSLEDARIQDLQAIKAVAEGQTAILVKLEGVLTELRLTRPAARSRGKASVP